MENTISKSSERAKFRNLSLIMKAKLFHIKKKWEIYLKFAIKKAHFIRVYSKLLILWTHIILDSIVCKITLRKNMVNVKCLVIRISNHIKTYRW